MNQLKWIAVLSTAFLFNIPSISVYGQNGTKEENSSMINAATISCRKLLKLEDSDKEATIAYFHGFISGKKNELMVDVDKLGDISEKVVDRCIDRPNDSLLSVFERYRR
ncbi:MAG: HdeA/HdeB family chaperone [Xenococcaceae cyanobacterium MO_188.B19]|nr:HdeA/HdeB family chaperone [Xenococcaceae cyanobacterium MO_188.B19]